jgi:predicted phage terminase large subunit-like protein
LDKVRIRQSAQMLAAAREDFGLFCVAVHRGYQTAHLQEFCRTLMAMEAGKLDRLCAALPPRHGKTLTLSLYASWQMGRHPEQSVAIASYNEQIAQELGRSIQRTLKGAAHRAIFPECVLSTEVGSSENIETKAGGHVYSVSRNGTLTGRGCRIFIADDLLKDQAEAASPVVRSSIHEWYSRVVLTRLTSDGKIILCSTRWHEDDLQGRILRQEGEKWTALNFEAIAAANDPLGRSEGEALWPSRFDVKYLARRRAEMGSRAFVSLYQGAPAEATGNVFKRDEWRYYATLPPFKRIVLSVDTAFKTTSQADYSAPQIWAEAQSGYYLLAAHRARLAYPDLRRLLISFCEQWKPEVVLIEDAASGQSLLQELRETTALPLKPIKPDRDKISRAEAVTPLLEAGRVFLPESAPWLNDFLDELSSFPNGTHDDQVDACTQALNFLRGQNSVLGVLELMRGGWDGFVNLFRAESPRPNLGKQATFEVERQIRGLVATQPKSWTPPKVSECPECKSPLTAMISAIQAHCNQCKMDFFPAGPPKFGSPTRGDYLAGRVHARQFRFPGQMR